MVPCFAANTSMTSKKIAVYACKLLQHATLLLQLQCHQMALRDLVLFAQCVCVCVCMFMVRSSIQMLEVRWHKAQHFSCWWFGFAHKGGVPFVVQHSAEGFGFPHICGLLLDQHIAFLQCCLLLSTYVMSLPCGSQVIWIKIQQCTCNKHKYTHAHAACFCLCCLMSNWLHICHNMPHTHIVCIVHVYDDTHIQCICSCLVFNVCVLWSTPSITWSCSMEAFLNQKMVSCHSAPLMMMYWSCSMVMLQHPSPASFGTSQSMMQVCLRGQHQLTQGLDTRRHRANFKWKANRVRSRARALVMQGTRCCEDVVWRVLCSEGFCAS